MDKSRAEVMFWKGNEAIHWGFQTMMIFEDESQVKPFLDVFTCGEGCTEITVKVYSENECVDSYSYNVK